MTEQDYAARVRKAIGGQLEHGLRHVPGATPREERYYNDGQAFGLRWALDAVLAILAAPAPSEPGLDAETLARAIASVKYEADPEDKDFRLARRVAAEYDRLRGGQE